MTRLASEESLFKVLHDASPDGVVIIDPIGLIRLFNPAAERIFGYRKSDVIGRSVNSLMPAEDAARHDGFLRRAKGSYAAELMAGRREVMALRSDGARVPIEVRLSSFANGEEKLFLAIVRDLTERRLIEERVAQGQKMEAIGQLTGGIAHDFNNILTVISGNLEFLRNGPNDSGEYQELMESALRVARRGANMTKRLLAFARQQPLQPKLVSIDDLLAGMKPLFRGALGDHIDLHMNLPETLWPLMIDEAQLESAILNLIINARDAITSHGEIVIDVANRSVRETLTTFVGAAVAGDYVEISVRDNGKGISPEHLTRVIEPYFTTKGPGKGSGLGLSMAFGFVHQSGGFLDIVSEVEKGTQVTLFLPRALSASALSAHPSVPLVKQARTTGHLVLAIEDDRDVRMWAARVLRHAGYRVIEAPDARAGLDALAANQDIELVLTDVMLPLGMDGVQFATTAIDMGIKAKIILMSGCMDLGRDLSRQAPNRFPLLQKPFSSDTLLDLVARTILEEKIRDSHGNGSP
jgi:PAS domain S-box-containing protein